MIAISCKRQGLNCEFTSREELPNDTVSKYIAHCIEFHPEYLGELRETMTEDEIRTMLLNEAESA